VICFAWEASHGTQEFYFERAAITKRLIAEKAFGGCNRGKFHYRSVAPHPGGEPLERTSVWDNGELPETYPSSFDLRF
jgi:hypothetical protein